LGLIRLDAIAQKMIRSFAIVPAAGSSARMGQPKLLLPWGETTIFERVLEAWRRGGVERLIVVVHPDDGRLVEVCRSCGARVIVPNVPPPDMKASIQLGLEAVAAQEHPAANDLWLTAPADIPDLDAGVVSQLLVAASHSPGTILVPTHGARRGHPVLFRWSMAAAVHNLPAERGIDYLFTQFPLQSVECGPAAVARDIDTPADYQRRHDPHNPS
jgi:molybdenum cofactor cytidylyltransferase